MKDFISKPARYVTVLCVSAFTNPAVKAFVAQTGGGSVFAQVMIRPSGNSFELRHVNDRHRAIAELREFELVALRELAQFTTDGVFRPLKSAPNLQSGWRFNARDELALELALNELYPGAIADWFAAQSSNPPVTNYHEFADRQSGMYRITALLTGAQTTLVTRACCDRAFCLKRRLWSVNGLAPDTAGKKSVIPCLEPCAVLLEFARKAMRIEQEEKIQMKLAPEEIITLAAALEFSLVHPDQAEREADFNAPRNPRRVRLVLEKIRLMLSSADAVKKEQKQSPTIPLP